MSAGEDAGDGAQRWPPACSATAAASSECAVLRTLGKVRRHVEEPGSQ